MYNFTDQTIPESKKTEAWHAAHILKFVDFTKSSMYKETKEELEKLYFAVAAKIHPMDVKKIEKTITQRYCDLNLGPQFDVYPLIENNIEQLLGDYRLRPLRLFALTKNPDAIVAKLDEMYDALLEKLTRKVHEEISNEEGIEIPPENPEMELPEDDDREFFKNYRTNSEKQAQSILYFLLIVRKEKEKIYEALFHYLITGTSAMIMSEKDGHPTIIVPNVMSMDFDVNPNSTIQDDPQYISYGEFMPINDIFNTYDLDKKKKESVKNYKNIGANNLQGKINSDWFLKGNNADDIQIRTITFIWKSRIKQKFLKFTNDVGVEEMKILPEDYEVRKRDFDNIVELDIENIRHCTMIGPDVVLEYGVLKDQMKSLGNQKKRFIHVVGINTNNKTGTNAIRSIAKKLLFLQEYASEILYEIKLSMRQVDGGVLQYDLANIPKEWMSLGVDKAIEKVNFTIKRDRTMYINSADKKSNGYASAVQLSQKSRLGDLTALLGLIESLAEKISGVSAKNADYTKTGTAEINMLKASGRIENIFGPFDTFVEKFLERMILKAQNIYKDGQIFNYYAGDNALAFLKIMPEFSIDELGITLSDPRKELEAQEYIARSAEQMLPNMQDPRMILELIKIKMSDSASESIEVLERGIAAMEKSAEERNKAAGEQAAAAAELVEKDKKDNLDLEYAKIASDEKIAGVYADNKTLTDKNKSLNENMRKAADIESRERIEKMKKENSKTTA